MYPPPPQGLCLKRWDAIVPSGCRAVTGDVKRLEGGYWRLEMRLGLVLGYGNAFGVESGLECWGGGAYPPPPVIATPLSV